LVEGTILPTLVLMCGVLLALFEDKFVFLAYSIYHYSLTLLWEKEKWEFRHFCLRYWYLVGKRFEKWELATKGAAVLIFMPTAFYLSGQTLNKGKRRTWNYLFKGL